MRLTDLRGWRLFMALALIRPSWNPQRLVIDERAWRTR